MPPKHENTKSHENKSIEYQSFVQFGALVPRRDCGIFYFLTFQSGLNLSQSKLAQAAANFCAYPEECDNDFDLTSDMKAVLDERLQEHESTYLIAEDSIDQLNKKYGF